VWLTGSQTVIPEDPGTVIVSGELTTASNTNPGGTVQVLGEQVALLGATIDASGTQGGEVFIGGNLQGSGELPTAQFTVVNDASVIRADALTNGDGGQVIVWANGTTQFAGYISAQGGDTAGDGGFVEVSGLETLNFIGDVDTDAPNGASGTLLLDPTDITITAGVAAGIFDGEVLFGDAGPTLISEAQIESLAGNTNITIQASNSITIEQLSDFILSFQPGTGTISFAAGGAFVSNSGIDTNARDISITAGSITFESNTLFDIDATFTTGLFTGDGGNINLTSTSGGISFGSISSTSGLTGIPGSINISVSAGSSLNFETISTDSGAGQPFSDPLDGSITINGIAQPGGTLTPSELVGGGTPGGGTPGGGTGGGGQTVNINGAIVNIVSGGTTSNSTSLSNISDPNFSITIPAAGSIPGLTINANNARFLNAHAQSEIVWNNTMQDVRAWDAKWAAREAESRASHTLFEAQLLE